MRPLRDALDELETWPPAAVTLHRVVNGETSKRKFLALRPVPEEREIIADWAENAAKTDCQAPIYALILRFESEPEPTEIQFPCFPDSDEKDDVTKSALAMVREARSHARWAVEVALRGAESTRKHLVLENKQLGRSIRSMMADKIKSIEVLEKAQSEAAARQLDLMEVTNRKAAQHQLIGRVTDLIERAIPATGVSRLLTSVLGKLHPSQLELIGASLPDDQSKAEFAQLIHMLAQMQEAEEQKKQRVAEEARSNGKVS